MVDAKTSLVRLRMEAREFEASLARKTHNKPNSAGRKKLSKLLRVVHNSGPNNTAHAASLAGREASTRSAHTRKAGKAMK